MTGCGGRAAELGSDVRSLWRCDYDEPVETVTESGIPDIKYYSVHDRKNENEDPVGEEHFLIAGGNAFDMDDAPSALRRVRFNPRNESEATAAARMLLRGVAPFFEVVTSSVVRDGTGFEVTLEAEVWFEHPMFGEAPEKKAYIATLSPPRYVIVEK